MSGELLACPNCGSMDGLYSVEEAQIAYPARFMVGGGLDYTGEESITYDEGTTFGDLIDCKACDSLNMRMADLVPAAVQS